MTNLTPEDQKRVEEFKNWLEKCTSSIPATNQDIVSRLENLLTQKNAEIEADRATIAAVLKERLEKEKSKWVAEYMPADEGKDPSKWGFRSEKEAWDWIEKRLTPCPLDPKDTSGVPCDSCMAEWIVYQIPEVDQALDQAIAIIDEVLTPSLVDDLKNTLKKTAETFDEMSVMVREAREGRGTN